MILKRELYHHNGYIRGFLGAVGTILETTVKHVFGWRKKITLNYPEEKYKYSDRLKGKHILTVKENGELRCISCMLCVSNCPAGCIHIIPGDSDSNMKYEPPVSFQIEILRCIFCGYCQEACPVDAIRLSNEYELAGHAEEEWMVDHHQLAYRKTIADGKGILSVVDDSDRSKIRL